MHVCNKNIGEDSFVVLIWMHDRMKKSQRWTYRKASLLFRRVLKCLGLDDVDNEPSSNNDITKRRSTTARNVAIFVVIVGLFWLLVSDSAPLMVQLEETHSTLEINEGVDTLEQDRTSGETGNVQQIQKQVPFRPIQRLCKSARTVRFLFPHVNKAGGRSMESTFDMTADTRHRFVSPLVRSTRFQFELVDHHKSYLDIANEAGCQLGKSKKHFRSCETDLSKKYCTRWVFTLRDPIARTVSAFYTTTGRKSDLSGFEMSKKKGVSPNHFPCKPGTVAARLLEDPNASIEDWVRLNKTDRDQCRDGLSNLHVRFLAPEAPAETREQLELAKLRLKQMGWIGIVEEFEASMRLLSYTFGLRLVRYFPVSNLNKYSKAISPTARMVLEEMNGLDIELYEYGRELFLERLSIMERDTSNKFYNPNRFVCDDLKTCWSKLQGQSWIMGKEPIPESIAKLTPGEAKENVLCAPLGGCYRGLFMPQKYNDSHLTLSHGSFESKTKKWNKSSKKRKNPPTLLSLSTKLVSQQNKCLASFLILGARKGGTTSLYQYIAQHPDVLGVRLDEDAKAGELLFFVKSKSLAKLSARALREAYNNAFVQEIKRLHGTNVSMLSHITGESSVNLGPACVVPELVRKACGKSQLKLIFLARNPVDRALSQYKMRTRLGTWNNKERIMPYDRILGEEIRDFKEKVPSQVGWWHAQSIPCPYTSDYLNSIWSGLYAVHLSRWLQSFDREDLLVLKSEEFLKKPRETFERTLEFLGLNPDKLDLDTVVSQKYNTASEGSPSRSQPTTPNLPTTFTQFSPESVATLREIFEPYNRDLSVRFGIDTSDW